MSTRVDGRDTEQLVEEMGNATGEQDADGEEDADGEDDYEEHGVNDDDDDDDEEAPQSKRQRFSGDGEEDVKAAFRKGQGFRDEP